MNIICSLSDDAYKAVTQTLLRAKTSETGVSAAEFNFIT